MHLSKSLYLHPHPKKWSGFADSAPTEHQQFDIICKITQKHHTRVSSQGEISSDIIRYPPNRGQNPQEHVEDSPSSQHLTAATIAIAPHFRYVMKGNYSLI